MSTLSLMTPDEKERFFHDGYLCIPDVLTPDQVETLKAHVQDIVQDALATKTELREAVYHSGSFKVDNALKRSNVFDFLIDHPKVFGKLVSIIGNHIQLMGSEIFVRGPSEQAITGFHTDLGEAMQQILPTQDNLMIQVKAQFFLTDLSTPDTSNFVVIPGSHRQRVPTPNVDCMVDHINDGTVPKNARQILAKPGDVVIFPWTLWHAVGPNRTDRTRFSVTLRYGQLALRSIEDFDPVLREEGRMLTARQRRVLGDVGPAPSSYWKPARQHEVIHGL